MGLVVMGLVDMDLELVTDQVEAMVQDRVQDMEQVQGAISILSNINFAKLKVSLPELNDICHLQAMELDQNLLNTVI